MLNSVDIKDIGRNLIGLGTGYKFGYAGSYARGSAKKSSDLDIVVHTTNSMGLDAYMLVYNKLLSLLKPKKIDFDILDLVAMKKEDELIDSDLVSMGLMPNEYSAYKNVAREVVWFE